MNSANYNAYGDESYFGDIATYAIIGIEREKVATVENVIFSKINKFGLDSSDTIHCKNLFNIAAKKKTNFHKLSENDIGQLLISITNNISPHIIPSVGLYDNRLFKNLGIAFEDTKDLFFPSKGKDRIKIWQGFAFQAAAPLIERRFGIKNTKFWVDHDKTKINYLNNTKKKQERTYRSWCGQSGEWLKPEPQSSAKPCLLQIADLLAYSAAHAFHHKYHRRKSLFRKIVTGFNPDLGKLYPENQGPGFMKIGYTNREEK